MIANVLDRLRWKSIEPGVVCVRLKREIKARPETMRHFLERSVGQAALLNEELGFMKAAEVAMKAIEEEKTIRQIAEREGIPTDKLI